MRDSVTVRGKRSGAPEAEDGMDEESEGAAGGVPRSDLLRGVDHVRFEFSDLHGISRSKCVPVRNLLGAEDLNIDPSAMFIYGGVLGMSTTSEPIMLDEVLDGGCCRNVPLIPEWETLKVLPKGENQRFTTARVLCSLGGLFPGEEELGAYPRSLCKRLLSKLRSREIAILGTFEYEFTIGRMNSVGDFVPIFETRPTFSTTEFSKIQDILYELDQ